jgi:hypothetical protein
MVLRLTLDPLVLARAYVWQLRENPTFAARMRGWHSWQEADARGAAFAAEAYRKSIVTVTCPELVSKIKSDTMMLLARPTQEYELHENGRILYT